ncbi:hypothetical protein [Microtetraspora malaysiensis]|uniref:hypothetical protein n=1 Tax=Microtetraspora malaysiensis TaxID=161358 RepID=UPI0012FCFE79|nr:hypothetical protein [Microtetraspora malaysiensis]
MSVARERAHATEEFAIRRAFAQARGLSPLVASLVVLSVAAGAWGRLSVSFPQAWNHLPTPVPVAVLMPIPFACVAVMSLHSRMADFELVAARPMARIDLCQLSAFLLAGAAGLAGGLLVGGSSETVSAALRNLAWWGGIACLSGWWIGRRLAWVLPLAMAVPMYVFAVADDEVMAWAIPKLDANVPHSWMVSILVLVIGASLLIRSSRWQRRRTRPCTRAR